MRASEAPEGERFLSTEGGEEKANGKSGSRKEWGREPSG